MQVPLFLDILCFSLFIIILTNLLAHSSKCQHHNNIFVTLLAFTSSLPSAGQSHALLNYSPQIFMQIFSRIVGWSEAASSANLGPGCPQHTTYKIQTTRGVSASMTHERAHALQNWRQHIFSDWHSVHQKLQVDFHAMIYGGQKLYEL